MRTPRETHLGVSSVPTFRNPLASPGKSANTRRYVFPPRNLNAVSALCPSGRHYRSMSRERARAVSIGIAAASSNSASASASPRSADPRELTGGARPKRRGLGPGRGLLGRIAAERVADVKELPRESGRDAHAGPESAPAARIVAEDGHPGPGYASRSRSFFQTMTAGKHSQPPIQNPSARRPNVQKACHPERHYAAPSTPAFRPNTAWSRSSTRSTITGRRQRPMSRARPTRAGS